MKKLFLSLAAVAVFAFTSCSSDDDGGKSCEQLSQEVATTLEAFFNNETEANCIAFRSALQAFVDKNCEGSANLQAQIDSLGDCSQD